MNGFLNILKPPGMTSAAVVSFARRTTGEKHIGHAGTLDPDAAGILPVMIGRSARLFDYLVDKEKEYVAEVAFGCATDTQDAGGRIIATGDRYPDLAAVRAAAQQLTGDIIQKPGMFSAIKKDGKPLYMLAHRGQSVDVPERQVHIESIDVTREMPRHGFLMTVRCGRGTYIRSLCEDLGKLTGCPAHMRTLLRTQSGAFTLDTALTLEAIQAYADEGTLQAHLLPPDAPLMHLGRVDIPARLIKPVSNGVHVPCWSVALPTDQNLRVYIEDVFWGIARITEGQFRWQSLIPPEKE